MYPAHLPSRFLEQCFCGLRKPSTATHGPSIWAGKPCSSGLKVAMYLDGEESGPKASLTTHSVVEEESIETSAAGLARLDHLAVEVITN
jgi:hypothetical protein